MEFLHFVDSREEHGGGVKPAATAVRERPILFSGPMVQAILAGRKSVTRRVVKPQPNAGPRGEMVDLGSAFGLLDGCLSGEWVCPYGQPGDRLWVRETWRPWSWHEGEPICIEFAAGGKRHDCQNPEPEDEVDFEAWEERLQESIQDECETSPRTRIDESGCYSWEGESPLRWRPSIHMPRWASRLILEVTEVRVARLQEITEEEAQAEGRTLRDFGSGGPGYFPYTWDELNAKRGYGWDVNPWVWVVEFRVTP